MGKNKKNRNLAAIFLFILSAVIMLRPLYSQSIESAKKNFDNKKYTEAEAELKEILVSDKENIEAGRLLLRIEQIRQTERAKILTEKALFEIEQKKFKSAGELLYEAISLDPENEQARELYMSLSEVLKLEEKAVNEEKIRMEKKIAETKDIREEKGKEEKKITVQEGEAKEVKEREWTIIRKVEEETLIRRDWLLAKISIMYTMAESDRLDYIDSKISLSGAKLEGIYYPDFMYRMFGFSLDYTGCFYKISGEEEIDFRIHRANASARFRMFFFEDLYSRLTAGLKLNYHYFYLQNLKEEGAYNYVSIYGPSSGLFISDPVIYRFYKKDIFKDSGFECEVNYLIMPWKSDARSVIEGYAGIYYNLNKFRFGLGYRIYSINNEYSESYNDIELSAGYNF